ncbi:ATP-binding protein [Pedobacter sp. BMA]|uniref:ATP-binding protein n=1 Tax=Pedobacter sp. BMA TaxID=1663685 RepID=UPI00069DC838|nr:ATP-binding protein [Pedobacter sp. BMA]
MKSTKSSAAKYLLIVFLILATFGITAGLFINFSKIPILKSATRIVHVQNDFTRLDSCIFKLYNAENSCRMYVVSAKRIYYNQFIDEIRAVSLIMDSIEHDNLKESALSPDNFAALIKQKKIRTAQFIFLRKLSDSLINFSAHINQDVSKTEPKGRIFTARQFKSIVKIDTIKAGKAGQARKKIFARIFDAINARDVKGVDSSRSTLVKTAISADTSSLNVAYNNLQLKTINAYYLRLYKLNQQLKDKEKELLDVNHRLITSIVNGLKQYRLNEQEYYSTIQQLINENTYGTVENLDRFTLALLALGVGLLAFVFYMVFHLYRNEKALVNYSNKAALYALSKSRFLANMSHEIRTPLNSIVGFSEQLTQTELKAVQKEQVGAIRNSSVMLLDVVNDILDFSKYETGKVILEQIPFSPYHAIKDVFDSMRIQAVKKKIEFTINLDIDSDVYVIGDPLRLKQVVMNLLSNAIKFTGKGSISLSGRLFLNEYNEAQLKVSIADTGIGINPLDQRIIFDEFAQVYYSSTKEKQQGTGLGLAICKKIIEFQGGNISVKSAEKKGSIFSFEVTYQKTKKPETEQSGALKTGDEEQILAGKKILLADDNALNILLASTILKKHKIAFDVAYNGKEALDLFNENEYDLVLTDIQMPEMGGMELTQKIRNSAKLAKRNVPVLGVTANVMQEDRERYLASGMNELVLKPFLEQELLEKISRFIM